MTEIIRKFIETDFGNIHVRLSGARTAQLLPLVCLHMAPQSGEDFVQFMKLAGRDRLVIAPDYPGYGDSEPLADDTPLSIETYAKVIWQVLRSLDLKRVDILGYHTGSKVAIEMALQAPARAAKLLCISLSSMSPEAYKTYEAEFKPLVDAVSGQVAEDWMSKLKGYYDPELSETILNQKYATSIKVGSRSHLGFVASHMYNADILDRLGRLCAPVGLINPNDDLNAVTPLAADHIKKCILIEKPSWLPGFLDIKPESVLETINIASRKLDMAFGVPATSLAS